ncbi:hypothetical protein VV02_22930 [Luteipulveratus mongoliensis]|uniref:DUF8017 domain-containing protein n=1 Tax=Luteipulveratus mongoliensis TaxID=571913 RepID=A0A0K1JN93_9MICO|nr:hypothetical protein VV02_22930 [Luteipulveratus mongoliensis]
MAAVVAVMVVAIGAFALLRDDDAPSAAESTGAPGGSSTSASPSSASSASSSPGSSATPAEGRWQTIASSSLPFAYLVPAAREGWTRGGAETAGYVDAHGKALAKAQDPAYFKVGSCASGKGVARAWVGFSASPTGVVETSRAAAAAWANAVSLRADGKTHDTFTPFVSRTVKTDSGDATATQTSTVVSVSELNAELCIPPRVEITTSTVKQDGLTATLVMVRDLDVADQLPDDIKDRILRSLRPTPGVPAS